MVAFKLFLLLWQSLTLQAQTDIESIMNTAPKAPLPQNINLVRVQVFPHLGRYSNPQGRETTVQSIGLYSNGECQVGEAIKPARTYMHFSLSKSQLPLKIKCQGNTSVIREKALKSFTYMGDFILSEGVTEEGRKFLRVVNELPFEEYLRGVVPSEMPSSWGEEALKAQAVAARTYAAFEILLIRSMGEFPYDVEDTVMYQAYRGTMTSSETDQALLATKGEILTYENQLVRAYFSADNGGVSERAEMVWPQRTQAPYTQVMVDPYSIKSLPKAWEVSLSYSTIGYRLKRKKLIADSEFIKKISIPEGSLGPGQRPTLIRIHATHKLENGAWEESTIDLRSVDFQYAMGLASNYFNVTAYANSAKFAGRGNGHGVGMSQWGAMLLAKELGWNYQEILSHYFKDTTIEELPNESMVLGHNLLTNQFDHISNL